MSAVTLQLHASHVKIVYDEETEYLQEWLSACISDQFKYCVQECRKVRVGGKYETRFVTEVYKLFNAETSTLPLGLIPYLVKELKKILPSEFSVDIDDFAHRQSGGKIRPLDYLRANQDLLVDEFDKKDLRYYQTEAIAAALKSRYGMIELPTGAGKTEVMFNVIEQLKPAVSVIVVDGKELLSETIDKVKKRFKNVNVRNWSSDATAQQKRNRFVTNDDKATIVVSTYQSFDKNKGVAMLEKASIVFMDEAHRVAADTFSAVSKCTPWAYLRIGLSATPFRDSGDTMKVIGNVGRVLYRKTLKELVDQGYLAQPLIQQANLYTTAGREWLRARGKTHKVIVFFEHIKHLVQAQEFFGEDAGVYTHSLDPERDDKVQAFKDCIHGIAFVTPILDCGVDITDVDTIVLWTHEGKGKSQSTVKPIQRIGRGLRKHVCKKTGVFVSDKVTLAVVQSRIGVVDVEDQPATHGKDFRNGTFWTLVSSPRAYADFITEPYNLFS
jgi:superfamily II DNA or RNA helicase